MNARLISNMTMQPLVPFLESTMIVSQGGFNSLITELVDPGSTAAEPSTAAVICWFDTDSLVIGSHDGPTALPADTFLDALGSFCRQHGGKLVVTNTFCATSSRVLSFADVIDEGQIKSVETRLNARLIELARSTPNLLLIDIELLVRRYGENQLISSSFWYAGRIRYTTLMFKLIGARIQQAIDAYHNRSRKVLIVDLDDTLWGGIVGDVGPLGIDLSELGPGACYRDFQRELKALKNGGTLLAICSKNNPNDVDEVFEKNPMMIVARDDFASVRVNWEPKPSNILSIADELNLAPDSFVFIDDNPLERDIVATSFPAIAVPDFPRSPEHLPAWFSDTVIPAYFGKYRITHEDKQKTEQYHANESRRTYALNLDLEEYLRKLEVACNVYIDDHDTIIRASQMTQKTNQFNLTTLRCDVSEITRIVESPFTVLIALDYTDRFGREGIIGVAIVDLAQEKLCNLLMSCRVIGRKVEDRLIGAVFDVARRNRLAKLRADFIPTPKNAIAATFLDTHDFSLLAQEPDGRKHYEWRVT